MVADGREGAQQDVETLVRLESADAQQDQFAAVDLMGASRAIDRTLIGEACQRLQVQRVKAWDAALDNAGYPKTAPPGVKPLVQQASKPAPEAAAKGTPAGQQPAANARAPAPAR